MSDLSEDCWCAGWMTDLEFTLWEALTTGARELGWDGIEERDLSRLKHLHAMAGGWWVWDKSDTGNRFVTSEEWLAILAERRKQVPDAEGDSQADAILRAEDAFCQPGVCSRPAISTGIPSTTG